MTKSQNVLHVDDALGHRLVQAIESIPEARKDKLLDTFVKDNELRILLSLRIPLNYKLLATILGLIGAIIAAVILKWPEIIRIVLGAVASLP